VLREFPPENNSSQFPAFSFDAPRKHHVHRLNALLVVLNADMQFRRYRRLYGKGTLHPQYEALMDKTIALSDLLYYQPATAPGTAGEQLREDPRTGLKNEPVDGEIICRECGRNAGTNVAATDNIESEEWAMISDRRNSFFSPGKSLVSAAYA
jgi:hypothetical protein